MSDLSEALRLFIINAGSIARLEVGGELDLATVDALREHLDLLVESGTGEVEVDMARVTFCDATALSALVAARHRLDAVDRRLRIVHASSRVVRLLQITALDGCCRPLLTGRLRRSGRGDTDVGSSRGRSSRCRSTSARAGPRLGRLRRAATNGETGVVVVGDFNDWSPGAHPMSGGAEGWSCTVTLAVGRRYRFRTSSTMDVGRTTGKPTTTSTTTTAARTPSSTSPPSTPLTAVPQGQDAAASSPESCSTRARAASRTPLRALCAAS